jgi:hypothetical protein
MSHGQNLSSTSGEPELVAQFSLKFQHLNLLAGTWPTFSSENRRKISQIVGDDIC